MNQFSKVALAMLGNMVLCTAALAADEVRWLATAAATYGGDDWQVARTRQGSPVQVNGGGTISVGAGLQWSSSQHPVAASLVLNHHRDNAAGANAKASFARTPLDAMVYYTGLETVRFGVGLGYVFSPTVKATVDGAEQRIRYKNALSKSFEIGYRVTPDLWAGLRLSAADFKPKTTGAAKGDVTHVAVNLTYLF